MVSPQGKYSILESSWRSKNIQLSEFHNRKVDSKLTYRTEVFIQQFIWHDVRSCSSGLLQNKLSLFFLNIGQKIWAPKYGNSDF